MNLALNTLFLFLLIVFPGIVFRRFYYVGEFSKQFNSSNWVNSISISIIPGLLIQFLTFSTFTSAVRPIEPSSINKFYSEISSNKFPETLFHLEDLKITGIYLGLMIFYSAVLAQLLYHVVRTCHLDKKITILRFKNHWHYYFKGEVSGFKDFSDLSIKKVALTVADVLTQVSETETKLYKGFLRQHTINAKTGDLENIYLTDVRRYSSSKNDFIEVPGDLMIIPHNRILNINLKYLPKEVNDFLIFPLQAFIIFILLLFDPLNFFEPKNLGGQIFGIFLLEINWIFISTLLSTYYDEKREDTKKIRIGLLFVIAVFSFLIYLFI